MISSLESIIILHFSILALFHNLLNVTNEQNILSGIFFKSLEE